MKQLLDRLLERQRRLMDTLDEPKRSAAKGPPRRRVAPTAAEIAAEEMALQAAIVELEGGRVIEAKGILEPYSESAALVRTLTTLARILSAEGAFANALTMLKRAEALDPADRKVWGQLADMYGLLHRPTDEVFYRRQLAYAVANPPAESYTRLLRALLRANPKSSRSITAEARLILSKLQTSHEASDSVRVGFAETLYAVAPLADEARNLYRSTRPCPTDEQDLSARWVRLSDWCTAHKLPVTRLTGEGVRGHRPLIADLRDVIVFPQLQWMPILDHGRAVPTGFATSRLQLRNEQPASPLLMHGPRFLDLRLPRNIAEVDQPAMLIGGMRHYFHNTVLYLSSLAIAETAGVGLDLPLVVNDDLAPFQIEQLQLLGYAADRLIRLKADAPARFARLTVPTRLARGGRWMDPLLARWYQQRLVGPARSSGMPTKLYLRSSTSGERLLANEVDVLEVLSARGYHAIEPGRLSVREQIDLFAGATHIVAQADPALTNMVFAQTGTSIAVLQNRHLVEGGGDIHFQALAQACGHRYTQIACVAHSVREGQRLIDAEMWADLDALRTADL